MIGITGTKAQFDTAATDGNFVWASDVGSVVQAYSAILADYAAGIGAYRPVYHTGVAGTAVTGSTSETEARRVTVAANTLAANGFMQNVILPHYPVYS